MPFTTAKHSALRLMTCIAVMGFAAAVNGQAGGGGGFGGLAGIRLDRMGGAGELSDAIRVEEVEPADHQLLARARAAIAARRWNEALDPLQDLIQNSGAKLYAVTKRRYVPLGGICHEEIARLPPEGLSEYRRRVDSRAAALYREAVQSHDRGAMRRMLDQYFCSSSGGKALLALGDLELEAGAYTSARSVWLRLLPAPPNVIDAEVFRTVRDSKELSANDAALLDRWYRAEGDGGKRYQLISDERLPAEARRALASLWRGSGVASDRLAYPDPEVTEADVQARMLLATILEHEVASPAAALGAFRAEFPEAVGKIGGREVVYADYLDSLAAASADVVPRGDSSQWPTFGGGFERSGVTAARPDFSNLRWRRPIYAEQKQNGLPFHPVISSSWALIATPETVHAFDLNTGKAPWGNSSVVYPSGQPDDANFLASSGGGQTSISTLTIFNSRLFARISDSNLLRRTPRTMAPISQVAEPSRLVALDLHAEGKLLQSPVLEKDWNFEGPPVIYQERGIVGIRKSGLQSQAAVISFDLGSGRILWKQFVCAAEPATTGAVEYASTLLTLHDDTLHYATNLGAVAAMDAGTGAIRWLTRYPRKRSSVLAPSPALSAQGVVVVAPVDGDLVAGIDAATGRLLWQTNLPGDDRARVLGTKGSRVIASAGKLYWLSLWTGKTETFWPDSTWPRAHGRGCIADGRVYWPTFGNSPVIHVFDAATAELVDRVELERWKASAGNLAVAGETTLLATATELLAFGPAAVKSTHSPDK